MLIESGFVLIIAGFLVEVTKIDNILRMKLKWNPLVEKISGNIGIIFFIIGLVLVVAGVFNLYYG